MSGGVGHFGRQGDRSPTGQNAVISRRHSRSLAISAADALPNGFDLANRSVDTAVISSVRAQRGRFSPDSDE